jgi:1-pyrroline-5-carboxylate dehydrogenase
MKLRSLKCNSLFLHVLNNGSASLRIGCGSILARCASDLRNYKAENEPIREFKKGSAERDELVRTLRHMNDANNIKAVSQALFEVPIVIGDKEIRTNNVKYQHVPFDHSTRLARFYHADKTIIKEAIENCLLTRPAWENSSFDFRAGILLKAADKLATIKRSEILAATMLGQAKTVYQAGE